MTDKGQDCRGTDDEDGIVTDLMKLPILHQVDEVLETDPMGVGPQWRGIGETDTDTIDHWEEHERAHDPDGRRQQQREGQPIPADRKLHVIQLFEYSARGSAVQR